MPTPTDQPPTPPHGPASPRGPLLHPRALIGMIHVGALPGTPHARDPIDALVERALTDARALASAGFDAAIIENMHDRPYVNGPHAPIITAAMTLLTREVRRAFPDLTLGIQVLSMGHMEALAIAHACNARFIRVENFVYAHVADEGLLPDAVAGSLLRERARLNAQHIAIFADIKKKHASHALTADLSIADAAHAADFFSADGLIVTGAFTGSPVDLNDLDDAANAAPLLPVWVGSGATPDQLPALFRTASGIIVGSAIKHDGDWRRPVDPQRARNFVLARDAISTA